jgi:hypothetical protein
MDFSPSVSSNASRFYLELALDNEDLQTPIFQLLVRGYPRSTEVPAQSKENVGYEACNAL